MRLSFFARPVIAAAAIGFAAMTAVPAGAGTVTLKALQFSESRPVPHYHYEGPVLAGDLDRLAGVMEPALACDPAALPEAGGNCAVVTLNSPGGNYIEGLKLAHFFRANAVATRVNTGAACYSACAFAFLGGSGTAPGRIGAYIDRTLEPGGTLGFHAPYFAAESLGEMVAEHGLEEVLGGNRESIALMIGQLVEWNVDKSILAEIADMGADEAYRTLVAQDLYLLRVALPRAPVKLWNPDPADALLNACLRLIAYHEEGRPYDLQERLMRLPPIMRHDIGVDEAGRALSGFRIVENPGGLKVSYCAVPSDEAGLEGDADIALYTGPGIEGTMRPVLSFFHRPGGWSRLGAGGRGDRGILQKGTIGHFFMPPARELDNGLDMVWRLLGR